MPRVRVQIDEIELDGDYTSIPSVCATCSKCGHETESYGQSGASVRRCLVALREECPRNERNFYVAEDGTDED
jgi:hypothetical protein